MNSTGCLSLSELTGAGVTNQQQLPPQNVHHPAQRTADNGAILRKGQKQNLSQAGQSLADIKVGLGWDIVNQAGKALPVTDCVCRETVMRHVRNTSIPSKEEETATKKKKVKYLYVEADEVIRAMLHYSSMKKREI